MINLHVLTWTVDGIYSGLTGSAHPPIAKNESRVYVGTAS